MKAYVFGAGASAHAKYPLAFNLLRELSNWLDLHDVQEAHIRNFKNRIVQLKAVFASLDDFEEILGCLSAYGHDRVKIRSEAPQAVRDIGEDVLRGVADTESNGFYPQYLRDDLVSAVREFFYSIESGQPASKAYDEFARQRLAPGDTLITFNYDVALERALKTAGKWEIGTGYGFPLLGEQTVSPVTIYKLHGSVNWFQAPTQEVPPPLVFPRDIELLGYKDIRDTRLGANGCAVDNTGTLILPDTSKRFYWKRLWQPLWESAAERLGSVQEVFIHGYSLPTADERARRLLFENISRDVSVHIFCRSASDRIADEFRGLGFSDVQPHSETGFEVWASESTA